MTEKDITKNFNTNECLIYNLTEKVTNLEEENAKLKAKLLKIENYLANDIPHELMNEATNKIWRMI